MRFDLVILGDTPGAWLAAEAAAQLGRRTAVLRPDQDGHGAATGVAAVLAAFGDSEGKRRGGEVGPRELWHEAAALHERRVAEVARELGVRSRRGRVRLTGPKSAEVLVEGEALEFEAERVLIATGSVARRPHGLAQDRRILVPEDAARLSEAPARLLVLGGNRTARSFARLFAAAGSAVSLVDAPCGASVEQAVSTGFRVVAGEVADLQRGESGVAVRLTDRRELTADAILFAADRPGATADLGLEAAGLEADEGGRLWCDEEGRTWVPGVSAAGEVVGFPRWLREESAAAGIVEALLETPAGGRRAAAI